MTQQTLMGAIVAGCAALGAANAPAAIIASWNFNDTNTVVDQGSGTLTTTAVAGWTTGTATNALLGVPAGQALSFSGTGNNNRSVDILFTTLGFQEAVVTLAWKRNNNGYNSNQISYSTDGATFIDFGSPVNPQINTFGVQTLSFASIAAIDNQAAVVVRIKLNGASNNGGTNAMDNINIEARPVPAPGAIVLTMMGAGLMMARRRR